VSRSAGQVEDGAFEKCFAELLPSELHPPTLLRKPSPTTHLSNTLTAKFVVTLNKMADGFDRKAEGTSDGAQ
jgi:hypothetical protein